jgi:hypothetical protein
MQMSGELPPLPLYPQENGAAIHWQGGWASPHSARKLWQNELPLKEH